MLILTVFISSVVLAWFLTSRVRRYVLAKNMLDMPNDRSSHLTPTPRGGGIAIVFVLMLAGIISLFLPAAPIKILLPLLLATLAYATLGWQDDKLDLAASVRFFIQLLIAATVAGWLFWNDGAAGSLLMIAMLILVTLWITWMANLYNFMDGIDGLSAVESIILGATTSYWFAFSGAMGIAIICIAIAGASIGFMRWNWSPAKIFMGDVGSLALGAYFAIIAVIGTSTLLIPFSAFLVLYSVYLTDTGITLLGRMMRREKWWKAHRSHYYQRAVQSGLSHAQVSLTIMMINIILALLASLVVFSQIPGYAAILIATAILAPLMFLINLRCNSMNQQ